MSNNPDESPTDREIQAEKLMEEILRQARDLEERYGVEFVVMTFPKDGSDVVYEASPQFQSIMEGATPGTPMGDAIKKGREEVLALEMGKRFGDRVPTSSAPKEHKLYYAQSSFPNDPALGLKLSTMLTCGEMPSVPDLLLFMDATDEGTGQQTWTCKFPHSHSFTDPKTFTSEREALDHLRQYDIIVNKYTADGVEHDAFECNGSCGVGSCKERFKNLTDLQNHQERPAGPSELHNLQQPQKKKSHISEQLKGHYNVDERGGDDSQIAKRARHGMSADDPIIVGDCEDDMEL